MTKNQAIKDFQNFILPEIIKQYESDGIKDWPARKEAWGQHTDQLCKNGQITQHQYDNWTYPKSCQEK